VVATAAAVGTPEERTHKQAIGSNQMAGRGSKPGEHRGGRRKGVPNKNTSALKDAILRAAELVGSDGKGTDGLVGYLVSVAKADTKAFAGLLGKVLPTQLSGSGGGPVQVQIVRYCDEEEVA